MTAKYSFNLESREKRRPLPGKIILGRQDHEPVEHVVLKFLGFIWFFRDRLQIEPNLHDDSIPFVPDLVELNYQMRPALWIECGECGISKLDKLAVKVPDAEIWVLKPSYLQAQELIDAMAKNDLRRNRYQVLGFDPAMIEELTGLMRPRNHLTWFSGTFDPPASQFEFNGLWFDAAFTVLRF